jgi:hypothetical protein
MLKRVQHDLVIPRAAHAGVTMGENWGILLVMETTKMVSQKPLY